MALTVPLTHVQEFELVSTLEPNLRAHQHKDGALLSTVHESAVGVTRRSMKQTRSCRARARAVVRPRFFACGGGAGGAYVPASRIGCGCFGIPFVHDEVFFPFP